MSAQDRGWGPPGCTPDQLARVVVVGMVTASPYFPLSVRREVAPRFTEMCRWLVVERRRLALPELTCSGGYNKRLIRGSTTAWSEHSWGLAGDFCVATNPMQSTLKTDMPPGTSAKAEALGLIWGGDYGGRKDPMHFEYGGSPADAARPFAARPPAPAGASEEELVLTIGAAGPAVAFFQESLKAEALDQIPPRPWGKDIAVDGKFGTHMQQAVDAFQRGCGLTANGVIDGVTAAVLAHHAPDWA